MKDPGRQRLVPRFALTSLLVFAAVGVALWWVLTATIRERTVSTAQEHAEFVTHSVMLPAISELDVSSPIGPGDARYEERTSHLSSRMSWASSSPSSE